MDESHALWPDHVQIGEVVYPAGGTLGPRIQRNVQLVIVHNGEMTVWVDGVSRHATARTVSVLLPGHEERFAFSSAGETWHSWIHATLPSLPAAYLHRFAALPWSLPLSPTMTDLMRQALALHRVALPTANAMRKALVAQMLWCYIGEGEYGVPGGSGTMHPAVERARAMIDERFGGPLTLAEIAHEAAVSPAHLIRLFRAQLDTTPVAYLWRRRVEQGVLLLEQTGLSVATVAQTCGFPNAYHFSRRVRLATGLSPRDLRRRSWKNTAY